MLYISECSKSCGSLGVEKVIFLPDHYLANYVQKNTKVKIISWQGTCVVHEKFSGNEINDIEKQNPGIKIIAHLSAHPMLYQPRTLLDQLQAW